MRDELTSLADVSLCGEAGHAVALHEGRVIDQRRFREDVARLAAILERETGSCFAIYHASCYPFAVMLFALWHAGKHAWIPGNNRPATAQKLLLQGCRLMGEWPHEEVVRISDLSSVKNSFILATLDLQRAQLTIFTSGSSGEPKAIEKTLLQLEREVQMLEQQRGEALGQAAAVATVSHQHIYGLLFRLLWPLASGRCFHSQIYPSPETMLKAVAEIPAYWVSSPAQLKRLDDLSDWAGIARLKTIFSSGGPLPERVATQIEERSGQKVLEIFGSSETGGIGWRCVADNARWTPFPGIALSNDSGRCRLSSPFLEGGGRCWLDDAIELYDDGRFSWLGRIDRIVKVEEKRLSLDELQNECLRSGLAKQAHCLLLGGDRERIAAVIVPTDKGRDLVRDQGRAFFIRQLRKQLMQSFDTVVLPRKWLFMSCLPMTPQGKVDNLLLRDLLLLHPEKYPHLLSCTLQENSVKLELSVRPGLVYFDGHFPQQPILPGVAQLAWAESYGKIFFAIEQPFLTMEVVKFKKIIQPGAILTMTLEWKAAKGKLYFAMDSANDSHSSGRMVYGTR